MDKIEINANILFCSKYESVAENESKIEGLFTKLNITNQDKLDKKEFFIIVPIQGCTNKEYYLKIVLFYYGKSPEVKHILNMRIPPKEDECGIVQEFKRVGRTISGKKIQTGLTVVEANVGILEKTGYYGVAVYIDECADNSDDFNYDIKDMTIINEQQFEVDFIN